MWSRECIGRQGSGIEFKITFKDSDISQNTQHCLPSLRFWPSLWKGELPKKPMEKKSSISPRGLSLHTCSLADVLIFRDRRGEKRKKRLTLGIHFQPFQTALAFPVKKCYLCQLPQCSSFHCLVCDPVRNMVAPAIQRNTDSFSSCMPPNQLKSGCVMLTH